ncbi:protein SNORC isoform 3-T3 [Vipera latastei]
MPRTKTFHLILLTLSGVLISLVKTAEYSQGPIPTLWNDPPELQSGGGPLETTPPARFSESTGFPSYTSDYELEDTTHLHQLDNDNAAIQFPFESQLISVLNSWEQGLWVLGLSVP